ncbi:MAG: hypothetical protein PQJ46_03635 [Spirochaetales bacterium]|nr:hypothetical protein [Spirochaetales bacterium]
MEDSKETIEFWKQKRDEIGKEIILKSFVRFIGESGKGQYDLSGLLYASEERVYFEDFEKSSMFDFLIKKSKKQYEKFTMNFLVSDTSEIRKVSESSAIACAEGAIEKAKKPGIIDSLLKSTIWEISFKDGYSYFFEIFESKELVKLINNEQ